MGICFYLGVTLYATDALLKKKTKKNQKNPKKRTLDFNENYE